MGITGRCETPFATRLRELIDEARIPQSALAEHIGVTKQVISTYSLGVSLPYIEKFEGIADFFEVSTEYLLGACRKCDGMTKTP